METRAETALAPGPVPGPLLEELAAARGKLAPRAKLTMLELTVDRGEMPPLHAHDEPEAFRVVEGTLLVFAGGACIRLEPGRSTVVPAGVPHTHRAESARVSLLVASFVRSPGAYERFLQAVARPDGATRGPDEGDRVVEALAAENGIVVLGPPGQLPRVDLAA
jgi:quercetin dioxygenase-like cupin family protein